MVTVGSIIGARAIALTSGFIIIRAVTLVLCATLGVAGLVARIISGFTLVGVAIVRLASLAVCLNVDELFSSEEFRHHLGGVGIGGRGARQ